jgi:hypothetical protein
VQADAPGCDVCGSIADSSKGLMSDISITDPLGRVITLHDHTWYGHIVKRHPDVRPLRSLIESALRTPVQINHSTSDPDCRLYYGPGPFSGIMVVVVADLVAGMVKTAYRTARIKGIVEWSPPIP